MRIAVGGATRNQMDYIDTLLDMLYEKNLAEWHKAQPWVEQRRNRMSFEQADQTIKALKRHVWPESYAPKQHVNINTVPDGRFALELNGKLHFYRVTKKSNPFGDDRIKLSEYAGPSLYPVHPWSRALPILVEIAKDWQGAARRYANEIGSCWKCGRTLTDPESRARSMGPDCYDKYGGLG